MYRVRHKSINTPLSHERLVGGLQDGGRGTHVTHFVQLYPQPLYTASQVRTTCRSWDEGVLTDVCLTGVLIDLCLTLYIERSRTLKCFELFCLPASTGSCTDNSSSSSEGPALDCTERSYFNGV